VRAAPGWSRSCIFLHINSFRASARAGERWGSQRGRHRRYMPKRSPRGPDAGRHDPRRAPTGRHGDRSRCFHINPPLYTVRAADGILRAGVGSCPDLPAGSPPVASLIPGSVMSMPQEGSASSLSVASCCGQPDAEGVDSLRHAGVQI